MKGKIGIKGVSIEVKLLKDVLVERGFKIFFWKGEEFNLDFLPEGLQLLLYEIEPAERGSPHLVELLKKISIPVIFLAEEITVEEAVHLVRLGAKDVKLLRSPLELLEKSVFYVLETSKIASGEEIFVTQSPKLLKILSALKEIAKTKAPVLLVGESGTGKELLARYIHSHSPRKEGPFIAINCAALPETLLESELFGFEKGAFSGANFRKKGKIELADKGTLLLDEITEMSPGLQSKLLRVLQEGEVDRLGGYQPIKVDFRLISTTNRDIEKEVAEGRFRADLFYRINVITVKIPPLRERKEDILLLANYFMEKFSLLYHKKFRGFTEKALKFLKTYPFPGNVRELKNMLERAVITCPEEYIDVIYLTDPFNEGGSLERFSFYEEEIFPQNGTDFDSIESEIKPLDEMEREAILKALRLTKGNKTRAAELLGITVRTLRNKLKEYEEKGLLPQGGF
ncbi:MAG: sigma-54 dependent transcriptional regulator [Caldimicrobium sp.]